MTRFWLPGFAVFSVFALPVAAARAEYEPDPNFFNCTNATGYYDVALTDDWRGRLQTSDPASMKAIAGKWYAEFTNLEMRMTYNNVITYLETGVMEFTTHTCGMDVSSCSDDHGHGRFTAHPSSNGWIFVARNVTSLTRINACGGGNVRMEDGVLIDEGGTRWQRMQ